MTNIEDTNRDTAKRLRAIGEILDKIDVYDIINYLKTINHKDVTVFYVPEGGSSELVLMKACNRYVYNKDDYISDKVYEGEQFIVHITKGCKQVA